MKKRNIYSITILFALFIITAITVVFAQKSSTNAAGLSFKVNPGKASYLLGEPIKLEAEILNKGGEPIKVQPVLENLFRLFISRDGAAFVAFTPPDSERFCGRINFQNLGSGQTNKTDITILWQGKPDYSNLDAARAKWYQERDQKTRIVTDYAFPEPGVYFVKVKSQFQNSEDSELEIESEPAQIVINAPVGKDLEVWNKIRGNREIALLMQGAYTDSKQLTGQTLEDVQQIFADYPNSIYSDYLKKNFEKIK